MRGKELKTLRKKAGLTQRQLADKLGFSRRETISDYERGEKRIPKRSSIAIRLVLSLLEG